MTAMEKSDIKSTIRMPTLKNIRIAAPCDVGFENMQGDDCVRFCTQCKMNVYNIGNMSADEATKLIQEREGRLCVRLYRRRDGTVITDNCPLGLKKIRDRFARITAFAFFLSLVGWLSAEQAHAQGLVGAPLDGPRYYYPEPVKEMARCAKDNSGNLLLTVLLFLKLSVSASAHYHWPKETWFSVSYLVPFLCGTVVHFTYLGFADDIVLTIHDGLARSCVTGMTFGLLCLLVAIIQSRMSGEVKDRGAGRIIS